MMKRIVVVMVVLSLLAMSSVAEACGGRKIKIKHGGGLFHRRSSQAACGQAACGPQQAYQTTFTYTPPVVYQAPQVVYQTYSAPPVTYAVPQVPSKTVPQAVAPPQMQPQLPGKSTPQR
jgi:hypothetical protein